MNKNDRRGWISLLVFIFVWAVVLTFIFCGLTGCRTVEYVDRPITHTEYVYRDRVDSLAVHDSVYVKEQVKGDTVRIVEYRYKDRFQYIQLLDTVMLRDTVTVVTERVVEKTVAQMNKVQSFLFWVGVTVLLGFIGYLVGMILKRRFL